jgi:hypothetical protein
MYIPKDLIPARSNFAFLQSITQLTLAGLPQQSGTSHGLFLSSAHVRIKGPNVDRFPRLPSTTFRVLTLLAV